MLKINKDKLADLGYSVAVERDTITIYPKDHAECPEVVHAMRQVCDAYDLNDSERDVFFNTLYKLVVMSAIRKASNW